MFSGVEHEKSYTVVKSMLELMHTIFGINSGIFHYRVYLKIWVMKITETGSGCTIEWIYQMFNDKESLVRIFRF